MNLPDVLQAIKRFTQRILHLNKKKTIRMNGQSKTSEKNIKLL